MLFSGCYTASRFILTMTTICAQDIAEGGNTTEVNPTEPFHKEAWEGTGKEKLR
jgi:hypothetical protein